MNRPQAFVVVLVLAAVAGCLEGADQGKSGGAANLRGAKPGGTALAIREDWADLAVGGQHNHADIKLHENVSTANFETLGYNPLVSDYYGRSSGGYFCGAARERDGRRIAIVHSFVSDVALIVNDVTDAASPQKIGELVMSNTQVYDVALSPDLRYALLATSPLDGGPDKVGSVPEAPKFAFRDACTGETRSLAGPEQGLPYASGVVLVDLTNPRNPVIADFRFHDVGGRNVVLTTALNPGMGYAALFEIQTLAGGPKLQALSVFVPFVANAPAEAPKATYVHDGYIQKHPITGDTLLYLAWGTHGLALANVNDLTRPQQIAFWHDWSQVKKNAGGHFVHEALPAPEAWDGRHYTFIGEECGGRPAETPTCLVTTLDTTDPRTPKFVGAWTLPVDVSWTGTYQFSTHYIALVNRTLFVSNYHGGVWAVDVSTDAARRTMPSIGVYLPTRESPKPWPGMGQGTTVLQVLFADVRVNSKPFVLDLEALPDGTLVIFDGTTGLYTVRFDADRPAPPPAPWSLGYT
ncbi:MAG: hypothetical protein HYT80_12270 [Euryarchaeota archaeon]|nr:hypothetical protein [Euryarchaeota archaeon]